MTRFLLIVLCCAMTITGLLVYQHHKQLAILAPARAGFSTPPRAEQRAEMVSALELWSNTTEESIAHLREELAAVTTRLERVDGIATRLMALAQKNLRAREQALTTRTSQVTRAQSARATTATPAVRTPREPFYTDDCTEWPNNVSKANSDPWIVENHDRIRVMKPRLLVINFAAKMTRRDARAKTEQLIEALKESSRWHGYAQASPAFLQYQVWRYVECRDCPVKEVNHWFDYDKLYTEKYAKYWGVKDAKNPERYLTLAELVDQGYVHELWMFFDPNDNIGAFESIEWKPVYDEQFKRKAGEYRMAGNGGDPDVRWSGRSLRFNCLNKDRGIGCGMENLAHSFEGTCNSGCIPYFTKYFREYAMFNLNDRFGLPFDRLYITKMEPDQIRYTGKTTAVITTPQGQRYTVTNYIVAGGNVHFPPNARQHYDQRNTAPVMSTIENWRMRNGENGADKVEPWTCSRIPRSNEKQAPDCMGPWLIYWRQNMPGLDNKAFDDEGTPMKNWWPFLFY